MEDSIFVSASSWSKRLFNKSSGSEANSESSSLVGCGGVEGTAKSRANGSASVKVAKDISGGEVQRSGK